MDIKYPGYGPYDFFRYDHPLGWVEQKSAGCKLKRQIARRRVDRFMSVVASKAWEICKDGRMLGWAVPIDGEWWWCFPNGGEGHGPFKTRRAAVADRAKFKPQGFPVYV